MSRKKAKDHSKVVCLKELVDLGCDPKYLKWTLSWLAKDHYTSKGKKVPLHSLDSWDDAAAGRNLDDLKRIAKKAEWLMDEITQLKMTPLLRSLESAGHFSIADLLYRTNIPDSHKSRFEGLLKLPELAKDVAGPQKYRDRKEIQIKLLKHVRERTGKWQDQLVAKILIDVLPSGSVVNKPNRPISTNALRMWRKRHDLTY